MGGSDLPSSGRRTKDRKTTPASYLLEEKVAERRRRREMENSKSSAGSPKKSPPHPAAAAATPSDDARWGGDAAKSSRKMRDSRIVAPATAKASKSASSRSMVRRKARDDGGAEEEKVEIGHSESSSSDDEEKKKRGKKSRNDEGGGKGGRGGGGVVSGVPVTTGDGAPSGGGKGGSDVRNRPKPSLSELRRGRKMENDPDPLREEELRREREAKKINPRFAELHETGQWGGITKMEKYGICLLMLGAIIAAIVLGLKFGRKPKTPAPTSAPSRPPTSVPTSPPTLAPTGPDYREEEGLELMRNASAKLSLPATPDVLVGSGSDPKSTPQAMAAEFVLYDDPLLLPSRDPRFLERYALAVMYYINGGCSGFWIEDANWMGGSDHCDGWYGVTCDLKGRVVELNLSSNRVTGTLPIELGQLAELSVLDLSNNALTGTIPPEALSMAKLYTIQLNNNLLQGEFPFQEVKEGATILGNLWIQENSKLTGTITDSYCLLNSITLDCDNFSPKPVYGPDGKLTTFQLNCAEKTGTSPGEYTCNFEEPTMPPATDSSSSAMCGIPMAS
ncbi:hypothetical protein ACHAXA_007146 [Cyclostephanos tholiformis]|uniref:Uncharacterized protein n=1 Tax=Cyclostephanos tholiformis TaxID=382380 RepID=A0ABD3RRP0_9STRA